MLDWQQEYSPRTPSIQDLTGVFGVASKNTVYHTLSVLVGLGLVKTFARGQYRGYYAVSDDQ